MLRRRFYTTVSIMGEPGGHAVMLDDRSMRTPGKRSLVVPSFEVAEMIAAEWKAQKDIIDPLSMPLTRLANSIIDGVIDQPQDVAEDIAKYFGSDALCYRADYPQILVERQARHCDPVLFWAANAFGAHFILVQGVMYVQQPDEAIIAARRAMPQDPWRLGAMHMVTTLTGSALLALALLYRQIDPDAAWRAAHIDEDWNIEKWGMDAEMMSRRAARLADFRAAAAILTLIS